MFQRIQVQELIEAAREYPAVVLFGPRQSGKTTLAQTTFPHLPWISLEDPDVRQAALADPRAFLAQIPSGAILDEIQNAPELLSYLQTILDSSSERGRFILTGSHQPKLRESVSQSLAGRIATLELLPLSIQELSSSPVDDKTVWKLCQQGFYPRLQAEHLSTKRFHTFLRLLAGRIGQIVDHQSLANGVEMDLRIVRCDGTLFPMLRPSLLGAFLLSIWLGSPLADNPLHPDSTRSGSATYYHARSGIGTCTLPPTAPWDSFYVSVNRKDFAKSLACGACMVVRHDADSVTVRISDRCPGCKSGGLDLSRAAFRHLAPLGAGRIAVSWHYVPCPESSLVVHRTRGSSLFWSSLQVGGLPWPVETLSVATENGWLGFHRERHNQFTARHLPLPPWTLRTVDVQGSERIDSFLVLEPGATRFLDSLDRPFAASPRDDTAALF